MNGLVIPLLIISNAGECKGCDPYSQLLCGIVHVPSAMHTLYTYSIAVHGHSTSAYNIPIAIQWLSQYLCYSLIKLIGYGYSIDMVWRHFENISNLTSLYYLVNLRQMPPNLQ